MTVHQPKVLQVLGMLELGLAQTQRWHKMCHSTLAKWKVVSDTTSHTTVIEAHKVTRGSNMKTVRKGRSDKLILDH